MPLKPQYKAIVDKYISTDPKGKPLNKEALLKPNQMVARILAARASTLSDQEQASLKSVLTPQTAPALKKLLPELAKMFDKGMNANGG